MRLVPKERSGSGIRKEYDLSKGAVGKYAAHFAAGTNIVVIDRDLVSSFPDSKSVNAALRRLLVKQPGASRRNLS